MLMFDASNRDQCEVRRLQTSTPLQALVMLNDPHVLEASRVLAEQLGQKEAPVEEKLEEAFRRIVCRQPRQKELQTLQAFHQSELARLQTQPEKAEELLTVGEAPRMAAGDSVQIAALMQAIHLMYNMEETITKS